MEKLIIFDVDGVLEKEERILKARRVAQTKAIAKKLGVPYETAKKNFENVYKKLPKHKANTTAYRFMYFGFSEKEYFSNMDKVDPKGIISRHKNCIPMLREVSKKYKTVTYSNASIKSTKRTLEILNIDSFIDKAYSAEHFSESKPSIKNLKKIAKKEGFKTKDCVFIGNSPDKDIIPAKKAGMTAILFDPYKKNKKMKEADFIVNDLIEITKIC